MSDFKRYDSNKRAEYINVYLATEPKRKETPAGQKLVELTWVDNSRNERYVEAIFVSATFRADDKRYSYVLDRLKKGDKVTVQGPGPFARLFTTGEGKKKEVRVAFEIPFPDTLICHESLKDREVASEEDDDLPDTDGDKAPAADDDLPF